MISDGLIDSACDYNRDRHPLHLLKYRCNELIEMFARLKDA